MWKSFLPKKYIPSKVREADNWEWVICPNIQVAVSHPVLLEREMSSPDPFM